MCEEREREGLEREREARFFHALAALVNKVTHIDMKRKNETIKVVVIAPQKLCFFISPFFLSEL